MDKTERTLAFTQQRLGKLPPAPDGKRLEYFDKDYPKLTLRVTANGVKTFVVLKRVGNAPARITLGRFPDISVSDARAKALAVLVDVSNGISPSEEKRKAKLSGMTLSELFHGYLADKADLREASVKDCRKNMRTFADWMDKPIDGIIRDMVLVRRNQFTGRRGGDNKMWVLRLLMAWVDVDFSNDCIIARDTKNHTDFAAYLTPQIKPFLRKPHETTGTGL